MTLKKILEDYYKTRGLTWPTFDDALHFADMEKAEALEVLFAKKTEYLRNNPETKPKWDPAHFEEEMGDFLMMVQVAGMREGVDPLAGLIKKLNRKAGKEYEITARETENLKIDSTFPLRSGQDPSTFGWKLIGIPKMRDAINSHMSDSVSEILELAMSQVEDAIKRILSKLNIDPFDYKSMKRFLWVTYQGSPITKLYLDSLCVLEYEFTGEGFVVREAQ